MCSENEAILSPARLLLGKQRRNYATVYYTLLNNEDIPGQRYRCRDWSLSHCHKDQVIFRPGKKHDEAGILNIFYIAILTVYYKQLYEAVIMFKAGGFHDAHMLSFSGPVNPMMIM
jgi:hypothetical protein